jgi:hypothetical protein
MAQTDSGQEHAPCKSTFVKASKHCSRYFADPEGGRDIRCRKQAVYECEHGQYCAACDEFIHRIYGRHPGDFVCVICDQHFHDRDAPEVHDHIAACVNRNAVSDRRHARSLLLFQFL